MLSKVLQFKQVTQSKLVSSNFELHGIVCLNCYTKKKKKQLSKLSDLKTNKQTKTKQKTCYSKMVIYSIHYNSAKMKTCMINES